MTASSRRRPIQWVGLVVGVTIIVSALGVGGWLMARSLFDNQWQLTLAELMANDPDAADPTTEVVEITSDVCVDGATCVEAYDTAEATYYRFTSRADAEAFASTVDDGFRSNYIVMDFAGKDATSKEQQLWAMQYLAGTWQDYEGGFPDR
ncbi:hypothetical protein [Microbacterium sulfonylureivorans]|uniref:hypothetical protein n=1 Tax=Microbacterium sulfonylureivorans TaxID=2486854 RepID=UPI000FD7B938|nr:hypothetical protein [Microbacterium sulfonylureivorans]